MTRMRVDVTMATPSRVEIISKNRLSRYFHIRPHRFGGRRGAPGIAGALLREPDRIELVVQVVTRGDGPALHLRQVRDDPVPLQRVDDVRLVVEQPLLELPQDLLALLEIGGPPLPAEQVVDDR